MFGFGRRMARKAQNAYTSTGRRRENMANSTVRDVGQYTMGLTLNRKAMNGRRSDVRTRRNFIIAEDRARTDMKLVLVEMMQRSRKITPDTMMNIADNIFNASQEDQKGKNAIHVNKMRSLHNKLKTISSLQTGQQPPQNAPQPQPPPPQYAPQYAPPQYTSTAYGQPSQPSYVTGYAPPGQQNTGQQSTQQPQYFPSRSQQQNTGQQYFPSQYPKRTSSTSSSRGGQPRQRSYTYENGDGFTGSRRSPVFAIGKMLYIRYKKNEKTVTFESIRVRKDGRALKTKNKIRVLNKNVRGMRRVGTVVNNTFMRT